MFHLPVTVLVLQFSKPIKVIPLPPDKPRGFRDYQEAWKWIEDNRQRLSLDRTVGVGECY